MNPPRIENSVSGELDVTQVTTHELELKRKDLLPVFYQFHSTESALSDRRILRGIHCSSSPVELYQDRDKVNEQTVISHSNPASLSSTESSDGGSSRRIENILDLDHVNVDKPITTYYDTATILNQDFGGSNDAEFSLVNKAVSHLHYQLSIESTISPNGKALVEATSVSDTYGIEHDLALTFNHFDARMNINTGISSPSNQQNYVDLENFFHEGYCKSFEDGERDQLVEEVTDDVEPDSKLGKSKVHGDDLETDDSLGGMFHFSEKG